MPHTSKLPSHTIFLTVDKWKKKREKEKHEKDIMTRQKKKKRGKEKARGGQNYETFLLLSRIRMDKALTK